MLIEVKNMAERRVQEIGDKHMITLYIQDERDGSLIPFRQIPFSEKNQYRLVDKPQEGYVPVTDEVSWIDVEQSRMGQRSLPWHRELSNN